MTGVTQDLVRYVKRGTLGRRPSFGLLLAERMPEIRDPIDLLLAEAEAGPSADESELPNVETLGLLG